MSHFTYDQYPFDSESQIRLLELEYSASGIPQWRFTQPITISATGEIEAGSQFAALSYEWGSPEHTGTFIVDGKEMTLRCNLIDALHALPELRTGRTIPTAFWIDSICINQDNLEEKADQIRLLRDIYSSATCVLSWLGLMADGSHLAMKYLRGINLEAALCVNPLLNRRYWTRLWMVQEVILGKQWYVACGLDMIDGEDLIRLFYGPGQFSNRESAKWHESKAAKFICERDQFRGKSKQISHRPGVDERELSALPDLILRFYELECEFKVDKIRALLALSAPGTVGNIPCLLELLVKSLGDNYLTESATSEICNEMCRLAGLNMVLNKARHGDLVNFVKGVLGGCVEKMSLDLLAGRLQFLRLRVEVPAAQQTIQPSAAQQTTEIFECLRSTPSPAARDVASSYEPWKNALQPIYEYWRNAPHLIVQQTIQIPRNQTLRPYLPSHLLSSPSIVRSGHLPRHASDAAHNAKKTSTWYGSPQVVNIPLPPDNSPVPPVPDFWVAPDLWRIPNSELHRTPDRRPIFTGGDVTEEMEEWRHRGGDRLKNETRETFKREMEMRMRLERKKKEGN